MGRRWWPYVTGGRSAGTGLPESGQLIAYRDRRAWRVVEVTDREPANWHEETTRVWRLAGEPDPSTWSGQERVILAEPARGAAADGSDRRGLPLFPWAHDTQWWPLPDPYPACVDCGRLWPCPCDNRNREAAEALAELERLGRILPGCCWACGEPVSSRHHSVVFDGENLLLPGAGPVVFHTSRNRKAGSRRCRSVAEQYERRWLEAAPGRLARLTCPGSMWRHPGYAECTVGDLCPGGQASHDHWHHCLTFTSRYSQGVWVDVVPPTNCGYDGCRGPRLAALPEAVRDEQ